MSSSLDAWLAAMPVRELQDRIRKLESELESLRALERAATLRAAPQGEAPSPPEIITDPDVEAARAVTRRRLSRERRLILDMIRRHPKGVGPHDVGEGLRQQGVPVQDNAVQTTMSRMVKAGQLVRVEQGRYRLPSDISAPSLLNGSAGGEQG